jgi:hypothetical protein
MDFTATKYFEVTQTAFGRTCWNNTHVGLLGQEVTDGYSLSQHKLQNYIQLWLVSLMPAVQDAMAMEGVDVGVSSPKEMNQVITL